MIPPGWCGIAYIPSQSWPRYFFYPLDQSCGWGQPSFLLLGNRKLNLALESLQTFLPLSLCTWVCLNRHALRKCSMTWVRIQTTEDEPNPTLEPWWQWPQILTYGGLAGESRLTNDRDHDWLNWHHHHGWLSQIKTVAQGPLGNNGWLLQRRCFPLSGIHAGLKQPTSSKLWPVNNFLYCNYFYFHIRFPNRIDVLLCNITSIIMFTVYIYI